jgi:hypothetical protein
MKKQLLMSSEVAFSFKKIPFNQKGRAGAGKLAPAYHCSLKSLLSV